MSSGKFIEDNEVISEIWSCTNVVGRVQDGAKWLDSVHPNWYLDINIDILNMASGDCCICGQAFLQELMSFNANKSMWTEDEGYENAYEYVIYEKLSDFDDVAGMYSVAANFGFTLAMQKSVKDSTYVFLDDHQLRSLQDWQWDLLASEWIMQIQKRIVQSSI